MGIDLLYVSYDGLLDPLGGSQILPYLSRISLDRGGAVVLTFEKRDREAKDGEAIANSLNELGIKWYPLRFTGGMGFVGKTWDLLKMYSWGLFLAVKYGVRNVHTRGHAATQTGLLVKRMTGAKLIFDFRGLWVDERVDKGGWDLRLTTHHLQYRVFKRTERKLLEHADQLVVLTKAVVPEVRRLGFGWSKVVTVIPCCADFDHFKLADFNLRAKARDALDIPRNARVLGYLGSVGRMYMFDRIFRMFELAQCHTIDTHFLVVTQDTTAINELIIKYLPVALHKNVHIRPATREQVPQIIVAMDVLVSFIEPSYARMAASPTKLAECFAAGIPVVCNDGVGDVAEQVKYLEAGMVVDPKSDEALASVVANINDILKLGGPRLREAAREILSLEVAMSRYRSVYEHLNSYKY